eukprot:365598-Chlamydomonas_euryale.AAC.12
MKRQPAAAAWQRLAMSTSTSTALGAFTSTGTQMSSTAHTSKAARRRTAAPRAKPSSRHGAKSGSCRHATPAF